MKNTPVWKARLERKSMERERRRHVAQEDRNRTSERVSELTRYVAFGVLAAQFTLILGDSGLRNNLLLEQRSLFLATLMCAILAILGDFAQYIIGYGASARALRSTDGLYQPKWQGWRLRFMFFYAKQVLAFMSGLMLLVLLSIGILSGAPS